VSRTDPDADRLDDGGLVCQHVTLCFAEMKNFFAEMQIARVFLNGNPLIFEDQSTHLAELLAVRFLHRNKGSC
jgi:hypothetical protein